MRQARQLSLVKGEHRFVFRYEDGYEERVVDAFFALVADDSSGFDFYDAAVLSYQLGRRQEQSQTNQSCSDPNGLPESG